VYKDIAENHSYHVFDSLRSKAKIHTAPTLLPGALGTGARALGELVCCFFCLGTFAWREVGKLKYAQFNNFRCLYEEYDFVFFGDSGQGDMLCADYLGLTPRGRHLDTHSRNCWWGGEDQQEQEETTEAESALSSSMLMSFIHNVHDGKGFGVRGTAGEMAELRRVALGLHNAGVDGERYETELCPDGTLYTERKYNTTDIVPPKGQPAVDCTRTMSVFQGLSGDNPLENARSASDLAGTVPGNGTDTAATNTKKYSVNYFDTYLRAALRANGAGLISSRQLAEVIINMDSTFAYLLESDGARKEYKMLKDIYDILRNDMNLARTLKAQPMLYAKIEKCKEAPQELFTKLRQSGAPKELFTKLQRTKTSDENDMSEFKVHVDNP